MSRVLISTTLILTCWLVLQTAGQDSSQAEFVAWTKRIDEAVAAQDLKVLAALSAELLAARSKMDPEISAQLLDKLASGLNGMGHPEQSRADGMSRQLALEGLKDTQGVSFRTQSNLVLLTTQPLDATGTALSSEDWLRFREEQFDQFIAAWSKGNQQRDPQWDPKSKRPRVVAAGDFPAIKDIDKIQDPELKRQAQVEAERLAQEQKSVRSFHFQRQLHEDLERYTKRMQSKLTGLCDTPPFQSSQQRQRFKARQVPDELADRILQLRQEPPAQ